MLSVPLGGVVTFTAGNLTSLFGFFSPLASAWQKKQLKIVLYNPCAYLSKGWY